MNQPTRISEVTRYQRGTNELLDKMITDRVPYIIQGSKGRIPVLADNEDEAVDRYRAMDRPSLEIGDE